MTSTVAGASPVELLVDFANTLDVEDGSDQLGTRGDLTRWLHQHGLLARRTPSTDDEVTLAKQLRAGVREALTAHHAGATVDSPDLRAATAALPLTLQCCADSPRLEPVDKGVRGALARIVAAVNEAVIDGDWARLKLCPDDTCQWAFYDATKNRSKSWCDGGCGNRAKTRSYRERRRSR